MNARDRDFALFGANVAIGIALLLSGSWVFLLNAFCAVVMYHSGKGR